MNYASIMAGFGGQGILMIGNVLSIWALEQGLNCTFFPSYGVEMRGGTANCTVTISDTEVGSPVTARPHGVVAMNGPSVEKFGPRVQEGGFLLINTDMAQEESFEKEGVEVLRIACNTIATELGNAKLASMVALGAFVAKTGIVSIASLVAALPKVLPEKIHKLIPVNEKALREGAKYAETN